MVALTSASFVVLFACSWIFVLCQETPEVTVKAGENATLQCQSHRGADIEVIKWIRSDLKSDGFVFYLTPDKINGEYQNSLFQGRVELQDPEKKNRDASVILKNVNINDTGTYECQIAVKNSGRRKRAAPKTISTVMLTVTEPGHTAGDKEGGDKEGGDKEGGDKEGGDKEGGGQERNVVGLTVAVLLVAVVVAGMMVLKKLREKTTQTAGETNPKSTSSLI